MNLMSPLISVIMGVRYRRKDLCLLESAIRSVLSQSLADFELLICGDGSSEAANEFLALCAEKDPRVRLICGNGKYTLPEKLNVCLEMAKGKFIARMDDDDFSCHNRFEKQIEFLNLNPEIAFVGCNVALTRNGVKVGQRNFPEYPEIQDFYITQPYIHPTLIFRCEALKAVQGYSEHRRCLLCEDYDLLLRLYAHGFRGANLQETLFYYTVPATAKGSRKMKHRWNESVTRWRRFRELGVLPHALPYVIKPIAVGLLPESILAKVKDSRKGDRAL